MASITVAEFRARFPEFSVEANHSGPFIQLRITDTECDIDEAQFGCFFARAQAYLVAHYIAISEMTAVGGAGSGSESGQQTHNKIASESEGDTSVSYGGNSSGVMAGAGKDELLASTLYGQQFIEFRSKAILGVASSGSVLNAISRI